MKKYSTTVIILAGLVLGGCEAPQDDGPVAPYPYDTDGEGGGDGDSDPDADGDPDDGDSDVEDGVGSDACEPGEVWCRNGAKARCKEDGVGWEELEDCAEDGLVCAAGECRDVSVACATAMNQRSYIGCEYWGVTLSNRSINTDEDGQPMSAEPFFYAIAVANDGDESASVRVTDGASIDNSYKVPAGEMLVIDDLPWKKALKEPAKTDTNGDPVYASRKVANGAYRITSSHPVTVYQFNPLDYQAGSFFSYSNDASLLLPAHAYRDEYVAITRPTMKVQLVNSTFGTRSDIAAPGFLAIVGPAEGDTKVQITFTSHTLASDSESDTSYGSYEPGDVKTFLIHPYDVLQLLSGDGGGSCPDEIACTGDFKCCNTTRSYDLTGTIVEVVDGPSPAVFAGTDCSFIPYNTWACDHLEQQLFPTETLGSRYLCAHNTTQSADEPTVWRIMSASDDNRITFEPGSVHDDVTLDKGEFVEFESGADFAVEGEGRVAVAQFMVGQNYSSDVNPPQNGDPAMALGVSVEQYRTEYTFLAPDTYVLNYLTVIHEKDDRPELDGKVIAGDTVEITDQFSRTNLRIFGGVHEIKSDSPFGINVYGVGRYTSYMYPGGLDLKEVDVMVE